MIKRKIFGDRQKVDDDEIFAYERVICVDRLLRCVRARRTRRPTMGTFRESETTVYRPFYVYPSSRGWQFRIHNEICGEGGVRVKKNHTKPTSLQCGRIVNNRSIIIVNSLTRIFKRETVLSRPNGYTTVRQKKKCNWLTQLIVDELRNLLKRTCLSIEL